MLKVDNLKKSFGSFQAVKGVSFEVGKGEVLGFLGPNGAGKSTTMRMITGFLPPTSGTAVICGKDIPANGEIMEAMMQYDVASVVLRLFGIDQPDFWRGKAPESIFARKK